jgi:hypothetical protein
VHRNATQSITNPQPSVRKATVVFSSQIDLRVLMKEAYSKPVFRILSKEEAVLRLGDYEPPNGSGKSAD